MRDNSFDRIIELNTQKWRGFHRELQRLSEANLVVFSEFGKDGLEWGFIGQALSRREIGGDGNFLNFDVG